MIYIDISKPLHGITTDMLLDIQLTIKKMSLSLLVVLVVLAKQLY